MQKVTSESIKANFPQIWWEIYRTGYREASEAPEVQERLAKRQLERTLSQGSPTSTAPKASVQPQPLTISAEQARMNAMLGVSPETFAKYNHEAPSRLDPEQAAINAQLGLKESDFLQYHQPRGA